MLTPREPRIESTRLSRDAFAVALRHGRGSVVMHVRDHGMDGVEDLVLAACIEDQCFDSQCEGSRAPWMYQVIKGTPAYPRLAGRIMAALPDSACDTEGDHLRELVTLMARDGDLQAAAALRSYVRTQDAAGARMYGAADLSTIDGMPAVIEMARRLGAVIGQDADASVAWLPSLVGDTLAYEAVVTELKRLAAGDAAIAAYIAANDREEARDARWLHAYSARKAGLSKRRERFMRNNPVEDMLAAASSTSCGTYEFQQFGGWAGQDELDRVLARLQVECNPDTCEKLLHVFYRGKLTHLDDRIWELASHADPRVRNAAETAMSGLRDPRLRELARQRVGDPAFSSESAGDLALFDLNYGPGDETLILAALERQKVGDKEAYDLGYYAVAICTEARSPALAGVALWVYRTCPCSICRRHAVHMLLEWGRLPPDIAEEARYDASGALRELLCAQP